MININLKDKWKEYSIYLTIAGAFLIIGLSIANIKILNEVLINTISGIITQLPLLIIIYISFKALSREFANGIKKFPEWLSQWEKIKARERKMEFILNRR